MEPEKGQPVDRGLVEERSADRDDLGQQKRGHRENDPALYPGQIFGPEIRGYLADRP